MTYEVFELLVKLENQFYDKHTLLVAICNWFSYDEMIACLEDIANTWGFLESED